MRVEAELDIADALDLEAAVAVGADQRAAWGSSEPLDVRRAQAVGDLARRQPALDLDGPEVSPRATKPREVVMYVHLSEAAVLGDDPIAHLERGDALVTAEQVRTWCGHPDAQVVVKPVLDPGTYLWTTPHGYQFLRDRTGTLDVSPDRPRPLMAPLVPTFAGHT